MESSESWEAQPAGDKVRLDVIAVDGTPVRVDLEPEEARLLSASLYWACQEVLEGRPAERESDEDLRRFLEGELPGRCVRRR